MHPQHRVRLTRRLRGRFRLENVNTVNALNSVQAIIREITERYNVPVDFASALLTFKSLEGTALTQIIVSGKATPGSVVYLDDGTCELVRVQNLGADGSWSAPIVTKIRDGISHRTEGPNQLAESLLVDLLVECQATSRICPPGDTENCPLRSHQRHPSPAR